MIKKPSKTHTTNNYTQQQKINKLQEEINKPTKTETADQTANLSEAILKKRKPGFSDKQKPAIKHQLNCSNHLRQINYDNIIEIRRTIENSTGIQCDPASNIINLSNKNLTKDGYKLLNKNFNSVLTIKKVFKKLSDEEMNDFYRSIKLKAHFRDNNRRRDF